MTEAAQLQGGNAREKRLFAVGQLVRLGRSDRKLSVENIAAAAGIGHVTWRRVEDGKQARSSTYGALDQYFELARGCIERAVANDTNVTILAKAMGFVDPDAQTDPPADSRFVEELARSHPLGAAKYGPLARPLGGAVPPVDQVVANGPAVDMRSDSSLTVGGPDRTEADRVLVQVTGPDGERGWARVTGPAAKRLELVVQLLQDLGPGGEPLSGLDEDVNQMLKKYAEDIVAPFRREALEQVARDHAESDRLSDS